jgi:hypothetical protein
VTDAAASADGGPDGLRILAGSPTEEESAAIAAVFAQLLLEQAVARAELPADPPATRWERTLRPLRHWDGGPESDWRGVV